MNLSRHLRAALPVLCMLASAFTVSAQTAAGPYWLYDNHYLTDRFIINPAFTGYQYYTRAFASSRQILLQEIAGSPATHMAGAHGRTGIRYRHSNEYNSRWYGDARNAVGGIVFSDSEGPFQTVGFKLDYSYTVPLNQRYTSLTFGLAGMFFSKRLNLSKYNSVSGGDPLVAASTGSSTTVPDFNAGILFAHEQLYLGISAAQLLENTYRLSDLNTAQSKAYRNYYLLAGYRFVFFRFEFEPSVAAGYNFSEESNINSGKFTDFNAEIYLNPVAFAVSYRLHSYITSSLMYRAHNIELGVRAELLSTTPSDARFSYVALSASYTFFP